MKYGISLKNRIKDYRYYDDTFLARLRKDNDSFETLVWINGLSTWCAATVFSHVYIYKCYIKLSCNSSAFPTDIVNYT